MAIKRVSILLAAILAATALLALAAGPASAALRHIDGKVLSKNSAKQSFRIETQSGNRLTIRVNSSTVFQRIPGGFGGLHAGLRVEVEAKSTASGLLARHVEVPGSGGGGGGGAGDGPNHT
jgi:uncharacterized protein DUF5666